MEELKRIIEDSEITKEDDALWPPPDRVGRQVSTFPFLCYHEKMYCLAPIIRLTRNSDRFQFAEGKEIWIKFIM